MLKITGVQVEAARVLLRITQEELGAACGLSARTISRFELSTRRAPHKANMEKIATELLKRGIEFTNGTGIGLRLDFEKAKQYRRANPAQDETSPAPTDDV